MYDTASYCMINLSPLLQRLMTRTSSPTCSTTPLPRRSCTTTSSNASASRCDSSSTRCAPGCRSPRRWPGPGPPDWGVEEEAPPRPPWRSKEWRSRGHSSRHSSSASSSARGSPPWRPAHPPPGEEAEEYPASRSGQVNNTIRI